MDSCDRPTFSHIVGAIARHVAGAGLLDLGWGSADPLSPLPIFYKGPHMVAEPFDAFAATEAACVDGSRESTVWAREDDI